MRKRSARGTGDEGLSKWEGSGEPQDVSIHEPSVWG